MKLETIPYTDYESDLPQTGQHILGQVRGDNIIVYQAFNPVIAKYAVTHKKFGGAAYSFSRMSWIKPNFLWMMYRSGWATDANQKRILSIEISLSHFETIVAQAVHTSFQPDVYTNRTEWETAMRTSDVQLQWDPDHHPSGTKLKRRAMQLGMKGNILKQFATEWIVSVEDITDFVQAQRHFVETKDWTKLLVIKESVVPIQILTQVPRTSIQVAGRTTTQGLIGFSISSDFTTASIVKVASETDFAALSQTFIQLVQTIVQTILLLPSPSSSTTGSNSSNVSDTLTSTTKPPLSEMILQQPVVVMVAEDSTSPTTTTTTSSLTIQDCLNEAIVSIRENISITDAIHLPKIITIPLDGNHHQNDHHPKYGIYAGYVHNEVDTTTTTTTSISMSVSAGTAAAIVLLVPTIITTTPSDNDYTTTTSPLTIDEIQMIGKQLAMHIVAAKPQYMSITDIPNEIVKKERDMIHQQLQNDPNYAKKPLHILEKILQGKLQKYYESIVLLEQSHYIIDGNPNITTYLQQHHLSLVSYEYLAI